MSIRLDIDCADLELPLHLGITDMRRDAELLPPRAYVEREPFEGPYTVTPLCFRDVVLPTASKAMVDDVRVVEIPYAVTDNETGRTVTIGGY